MSALQITINGTNYKDIVDGPTWANGAPSAGIWYVVPPLGEPPSEGDPEYEDIYYTFPNRDGVSSKRLGFRGRDIFVQLLVVNTTRALAETAIAGFVDSVKQLARYQITLPGGTARPGCKLPKGGMAQQWQPSLGGMFCCLLTLKFRQLSES